jgi:hypothetical protein
MQALLASWLPFVVFWRMVSGFPACRQPWESPGAPAFRGRGNGLWWGMEKRPHLYLVDGSAYIFRAYHRLPPLTNPEGTPVGAVFGYTTMLWKLADDLHKADGPTHLAVIRQGRAILPQRHLSRLQGQPPAGARRSGAAIPADPRSDARLSLPCIEEKGWRRTTSSPYARGQRGGLGCNDRFFRQGSDAACWPARKWRGWICSIR